MHMKTQSISATELKQQTAEILNMVLYQGKTAYIERHGKIIAKIMPVNNPITSKIKETYFGTIPEFPDVISDRLRKERDVDL